MSNKEYRPTLAQLRAFVTIAEHKHFGSAATKLEISQPSLSQALISLEQGLGIQLVERSTRKVIVTAAGERLVPYAKATLDAAATFQAQARGADGSLSGPLTIGVIPTVAPYLLPDLLSLIAETYPELQPRIVEEQTDNLLRKLRDGTLDLAVLALPSEAPGMVEIPLYSEDFFAVTPRNHPLAGRDELRMSDLKQLDLLLLDDGHCLRDQILDLCRTAQLNPNEVTNAVTRASSLTTIMQLVIGGLGTTLVPESALTTECRHPDLHVAKFAQSVGAQRDIGLVHRSSTAQGEHYAEFGTLITSAFRKALARTRESANGA